MWLPTDLVDMFDDPDDALSPRLATLRASALDAIPSLLDMRLVMTRAGHPVVTVTVTPDDGPVHDARSSLRAALPRPPRPPGSPVDADGSVVSVVLLMRASEPFAFHQLAADWASILNLDPRRLVLDQDLGGTPVVDSWEPAVIGQAVGILLDRGLLPDEGRAELRRVAERDGVSLAEVAKRLIDGPG